MKGGDFLQFNNCVVRFGRLILEELKAEGVECWVAGGAVRDYFLSKPITSDVDLFFPNEAMYDKAYNYLKSKEAVIKWESENGCKLSYNKATFDLVKHFFKDPDDCIHAFDFTVSMFAVDYTDVYFGATSFIDLSKKQLMINKITFPESTTSRMVRYGRKGFAICNEQLKLIINSIRESTPPKQEEEEDGEIISGGNFFKGID